MLPKRNSILSTFHIKIHSPLLFSSISSTFEIMNSCDGHSDSLLYKNSAPYPYLTISLNDFRDFSLVLISARFSFIFTYDHMSLPTFFRIFSTRRCTQAFHNLFFDFTHRKARCEWLRQKILSIFTSPSFLTITINSDSNKQFKSSNRSVDQSFVGTRRLLAAYKLQLTAWIHTTWHKLLHNR